jgi:hypothetical protein
VPSQAKDMPYFYGLLGGWLDVFCGWNSFDWHDYLDLLDKLCCWDCSDWPNCQAAPWYAFYRILFS